MSRDELPDGVPASNNERVSVGVNFKGPPDVATPSFGGGSDGKNAQSLRQTREVYVRIDEEDDDEDDDADNSEKNSRDDLRGVIDHPHPAPGVMPILLAIAVLFMVLGFLIVSNNRQPPNLCSQQPSWNQYNCEPG